MADIDIRLVKETPSQEMLDNVLAHIRNQGYHIVDRDPDDETRLKYSRLVRVQKVEATEAYRTEMDLPGSMAVAGALKQVWGQEPVMIRTSGATGPTGSFVHALGFPAIAVPTVNFDNHQHAENENLRLGQLWDAVVTISALLRM